MTFGQTFRFNGTCKCGAHFSALGVVSRVLGPRLPLSDVYLCYTTADGREFGAWENDCTRLVYNCASCGLARLARSVLGKFVASKKCNAKCLASTKHVCECSCGGKNHGAGFEPAAVIEVAA